MRGHSGPHRIGEADKKMGYNNPDPYYQPEKFGLTPIGELDASESYEFNIVAVWQHTDGRFFVGSDSGCSCPSPFEDFTSLDDLTELTSVSQLADLLEWHLRVDSPYRAAATRLLGQVAAVL